MQNIFLYNFVGMRVNLVIYSPLGEIKLSKHSAICILYKHEERMRTLKRSTDFDEERSVLPQGKF